MAELEAAGAVTDGDDPDARAERSGTGRRRITRARGLPGGRAVVGALLVTAAAVAVAAAYLDATGGPSSRYLVAGGTIDPGTRLATLDDVLGVVTSDALDLSPELAARAIPVDEVEALVGQVVVAPLEFGDLLTRSAFVDDGGVHQAQTLSFALPRADAVAGTLRAGERIDVLATYGSGDTAATAYVVRGVPVVRVGDPDAGGIGASGEVVLTVAVTDLVDVQALGHALATARVFVTRSTARPGDDDPAPPPFQPSLDDPGPRPDPAADPVVERPTPSAGLVGSDGSGGDDDGDRPAGPTEADGGGR